MGVPAGDVEKGKKVKIKTTTFYVWFMLVYVMVFYCLISNMFKIFVN